MLHLSHPTPGVQHTVLRSLHGFKDTRSRSPPNTFFHALLIVQNKQYTSSKFVCFLTGSSSLEELHQTQTLLDNPTTATSTTMDDSTVHE